MKGPLSILDEPVKSLKIFKDKKYQPIKSKIKLNLLLSC